MVDTPPSRSALDFLDAPERLSSFLDGRFIRLLLAPARGPARLMTAGLGLVTNALTKILGAQVLRDMQTFVAAFDTLFGGFRQRAQKTFALLQADGTAFLVVAAPEPDALREAAYFVERLSAERMPLAGLVVNRASRTPPGGALARSRRWRRPSGSRAGRLARRDRRRGLLRLHADRSRLVARETRLRQRFAAAHPDVPTAVVPALSTDVHDLDGLRWSATCSAELSGPATGRPTERGSGAGGRARAVDADSGVVVGHGRLEQHAPRGDVGPARSSARRSRSVMPPQTPHSIWLSSASARHSVRTGHPAHICLARFCAAPRTNSSSGRVWLQSALPAQSSFQSSASSLPRRAHLPAGLESIPTYKGKEF